MSYILYGVHALRTSIGIAVAMIFLMVSVSAIPAEEWNKTFGETDNDGARSVQQTLDGGYILTGGTRSYGDGDNDAWLIKTDANGIEDWIRFFGGQKGDKAHDAKQTIDGGYIITGGTKSYGSGKEEVWLIKTDANGIQQWSKTFGGTNNDSGRSVQQTSDGGYIIAGWTESFGGGKEDAWLIKTDMNGNQQWLKTFGGTGNDFACSVQQTKDGGYILAGGTQSYGAGIEDAWLIKTDMNGNQQWSKTFGGIDYDSARPVQQTSDGGYILAGWTVSYGSGKEDGWVIKTDANGDEQGSKTFGGADDDSIFSVQQTSDGGYVGAGRTLSYGYGGGDAALGKTDMNGNMQWWKIFGGPENDIAASVRETSDGGYILAGWTRSYGSGMGDAWLIKVSKDTAQVPGESNWIQNPTNGHYYKLIAPMNWLDAEARATNLGGHLVTINDRQEELWLRYQFGANELFWLGFNDIRMEGNWEWVSGEPITYTNWAQGAPNNKAADGRPENGSVMNWDHYRNNIVYYGDRWNDVPTNGFNRGIVETSLAAVTPSPTPYTGDIVSRYAGDDGIVSKAEAINALNDYLFNNLITKADAIEVLNKYLFG